MTIAELMIGGARIERDYDRMYSAARGIRPVADRFDFQSVALCCFRPLSDREREVLALAGEGLTDREIADRLCLSPKTVKRHLSNAFDKLGVRKRAAAVKQALVLGVL